MRVMALSDIHGYLPDLSGEADVLIIAGDLVPDGFNPEFSHVVFNQEKAAWLRNEFKNWLASANVEHIIVIGGNHDIILQQSNKLMRELEKQIYQFHYLEGDTIEIDGVVFHGSPWVPTFGNWAFMKSDSSLIEEWEKIPSNVNVLITHGPPFGILDQNSEFWGSQHVGSASLRNRIDYNLYPDLKLHVFGHIHPGRGVQKNSDGSVTFANVTTVNEEYENVYKPMFFEV